MSDINVNFSINQFNADFSVDPAPNVNMSVVDPMVANFYIEGTTGSTGTVTQVGGTGSGLGFNLSGNITSAGNLTLTVPSDTSLRTSLNIGNIANINLNGNGSQVLAGNGTWVEQTGGSGGGNVIPSSAITSNSVTVNSTSTVYLTTPLTLPVITPGLSYKVSVRGTMIRTGVTVSNAIIQLRCGNTGTISDVNIGNASMYIDIGSTQTISLDFLITFRTATTVLVNGYYIVGGGTTSGTRNIFGSVITVSDPRFLGISGALSVNTTASFVLTQAVITPYNIYPVNMPFGGGFGLPAITSPIGNTETYVLAASLPTPAAGMIYRISIFGYTSSGPSDTITTRIKCGSTGSTADTTLMTGTNIGAVRDSYIISFRSPTTASIVNEAAPVSSSSATAITIGSTPLFLGFSIQAAGTSTVIISIANIQRLS